MKVPVGVSVAVVEKTKVLAKAEPIPIWTVSVS
jgi:hypothetical protein